MSNEVSGAGAVAGTPEAVALRLTEKIVGTERKSFTEPGQARAYLLSTYHECLSVVMGRHSQAVVQEEGAASVRKGGVFVIGDNGRPKLYFGYDVDVSTIPPKVTKASGPSIKPEKFVLKDSFLDNPSDAALGAYVRDGFQHASTVTIEKEVFEVG